MRFEFEISKSGHAKNLRVVDDSGSYMMNLSGRRALEKYLFKYEGRPKSVYSIIFDGKVGGLPAQVPHKIGNLHGT